MQFAVQILRYQVKLPKILLSDSFLKTMLKQFRYYIDKSEYFSTFLYFQIIDYLNNPFRK
jgi:hypothetical protein